MRARGVTIFPLVIAIMLTLVVPVTVYAQRGGRGGRGGPAQTAKAAAPVDLTGSWVSVVTEDWRYRMITPAKGDHPSVPLNPEGVKVAAGWDPAKDEAAAEACRAYGAAGVMRVPGRLRLTWQDDNTLKVETEAGTQIRALQFLGAPALLLAAAGAPVPGAPAQAATPAWQGMSVAQWEMAGGGRGGGAARGGNLKVVTTRMRPGYLQKNGVPYSANAVLTEYFSRTIEPNGDSWLILTSIVEDPQYLTGPFIRSTHFKRLVDTDSAWEPEPCSAR